MTVVQQSGDLGPTARFLVGDVRDVIPTLGDGSVDLVLTSPPFLALRSYLPADHPDKALEVGAEPTPGAFIDTLLDVVEALAPKLAPHGSMCFELGDTYSGSGGAGGDYNEGGLRDGQQGFTGSGVRSRRGGADDPDERRNDKTTAVGTRSNARFRAGYRVQHADGRQQGPKAEHYEVGYQLERPKGGAGWPLDKSLCLIPELFRVALVYGFNPLTGRQTPSWRARNVIRWCRPNPPVGALGDKFRPATSDMVVITQSRTRYFDLDAVRTPASGYERPNGAERATPNGQRPRACLDTTNPAGAPPLDWWEVPTEPYPGSHYATWPKALLTRPILAMCPQRVCRECGRPSERIVEKSERYRVLREAVGDFNTYKGPNDRATGNNGGSRAGQMGSMTAAEYVTVGWTDCGHDNWRPGLVLDPFAGSGTTLAVASGHGREAIGIDLDERNAHLARERVGMFLEAETVGAQKTAGGVA